MTIDILAQKLADYVRLYGANREVVFLDDTYTEHKIKNVYLYNGQIILGESEKITSLDPEY